MRNFSTLFIIGNGFDISHELQTSYAKFKEYLAKKYGEFEGHFIPSIGMLPRGEEVADLKDVAQVLLGAFETTDSEEWNNFEDLLAKIDFGYFHDAVEIPLDAEGFPTPHARYVMEDESNALLIAFTQVEELLAKWLEDTVIRTKKALAPIYNFQELAPSNTGYLSFNYTDTLEEIYDIQNVLHIHGRLTHSERLIFGSQKEGVSEQTGWHQWDNKISSIHQILQKDVTVQLELHRNFFDKIGSQTTRVLSGGFSMGSADTEYLERICRDLPGTAEWYVSEFEYTENGGKPFKYKCAKLREAGFLGPVGYFEPKSGQLHIDSSN
ncbi:hypothetical protein HMPREF1531_00526 [Propionibacterium sp. oral taxon 192 str. F0372]|nr:hypothetical protein HMPREF1531_00526 [Propionibacterium sp. oral taxon 192 str. F0372]